ncbi:MAG TPA: hypothetical protein VH416_03920 [Gaiellaceae bacterium]|jgi:predicted lipoprotein with Yx(FWY)xxD motif
MQRFDPRAFSRRGLLLATLVLAFGIGVTAAYARTSTAKTGTVNLRATPYGKILVSSNGHTLYLFGADKGTKSACYGKCATDWPPLLTAKPSAAAGIKSSLLGTTRRKDGKLQVTYHGHPLYWFFLDKKAGQTKGESLDFFGGKWYVVNASGLKVVKKVSGLSGGTSTTTNPYGRGSGY